MKKYPVSLRTQLSQWLDSSNELVSRLEETEAAQNVKVNDSIIAIRQAELAIARFVEEKTRYLVQSHMDLLSAAKGEKDPFG